MRTAAAYVGDYGHRLLTPDSIRLCVHCWWDVTLASARADGRRSNADGRNGCLCICHFCWEILNMGALPWPHWDDNAVRHYVLSELSSPLSLRFPGNDGNLGLLLPGFVR